MKKLNVGYVRVFKNKKDYCPGRGENSYMKKLPMGKLLIIQKCLQMRTGAAGKISAHAGLYLLLYSCIMGFAVKKKTSVEDYYIRYAN